MEVSGRRKEKDGDDHTTNILCDPCLGVNEDEKAVFYCTVCNVFLCDVDARKHRQAAVTKAHILLDRNSMPIQKIGSYEDNICLIHEGEVLKWFCKSHEKRCCLVCASKEHKHYGIENIDDIAKKYEKSKEYESLIKDMSDLIQRLQSMKQTSLDIKSNAQRLHSEIISEIRKFRLEINRILDSLENASLTEVKGALHFDCGAAVSKATNCDNAVAKLQEMTSSIESLRKYKQERQLVMQSKNARAHVKDVEDKLSKLADINKRKYYKFIPDKAILQLLRSFKSLGRLEITENSTKPQKNDERANNVSGSSVLIPVVNQLATVSHVRDINIQHSTDTQSRCGITGGVMMNQTKLVLVDSNNDSVKLVDVINNNIISCVKLPSAPWDITRVEQDQAVVSCRRGKLVFLKVGKTLSIVRQLDLGHNVLGIAYTNNSLLVGFDYPDACVKVMDLRGKTLKTFKTDAAGNNLFKDPWYIALSEDQHTIFVSDQGNHRVTSLRIDGTIQGVYTEDNLKYPRCLTVDRNDNGYVAGCNSHTILQLSTEGKLIGVLHGIEYPSMLTYCKEAHKLYIGYSSGSDKNYISAFKLK